MNLSFINYRCPKDPSEMEDFEKKQILFDLHRKGLPKDIDGTLNKFLASGEISGLELVDVINEKNEILYQAWFYDFGTAMFFENETLVEVGGACQHYVECDDPKLKSALKIAYENASPKIKQGMDF